MNVKKSLAALFVIVLGIVFYTQITIFVIPPVGALPEGKTLIITRSGKLNFIDSPDAMCERAQREVTPMCRLIAMAAIVNNTTILGRLPYSSLLYNTSMSGEGGESY